MTLDDVLRMPNNSPVMLNGTPRMLIGRAERGYGSNVGKLIVYALREDGSAETVWFKPEALELNIAEEHAKALRGKMAVHVARNISTSNGTDPEIFAATKDGVIIPSWNFLKSVEEDKAETNKMGGSIYAYWDGFQAETSSLQPHHCNEELTGCVAAGLTRIYQAAKKFDPTSELIAQDVVKVDRKDLLTAEDRHVMFGCAPSENAYGIPRIEITDPRDMPFRFSGTHYHFSYTTGPSFPLPKWWPNGTAVMIDKVAGIILTALGRDMEDPKRREFYGRPGEFRIKAPGYMEYRTPGSFVMRSPSLFIFGADVCRLAFKMGQFADGREMDLPDAKDIIMNCDADAAMDVIKKNHDFFQTFLSRIYTTSVVGHTIKLLTDKRRSIASRFPKEVANAWNLPHGLRSDYRWSTTAGKLV